MKRHAVLYLLASTLLITLSCTARSDETWGTTEARSTEAKDASTAADVQAESRVVLQGLMAFVENAGEGGTASVDALLVNTGNPDGGEEATGTPAVVDAKLASTLYLPIHMPFIAIESGTAKSTGCFDASQGHEFALPWDKDSNGNSLTLTAYPLCQEFPCGNLTLKVGSNALNANSIDLDDLVDPSDFGAAQAGFLQLDKGYQEKLNAEIHVSHGDRVQAEVLDCTASFGARSLGKGGESSCLADGGGSTYAEQVGVYGSGPVRIELKNGAACEITDDQTGSPPRVWIFNAHKESYADGAVPTPHHEAFYWFYDLASTPFTRGESDYPRPCPTKSAHDKSGTCGGDPKCPQPRMTR